jgi:hypothetical protein
MRRELRWTAGGACEEMKTRETGKETEIERRRPEEYGPAECTDG